MAEPLFFVAALVSAVVGTAVGFGSSTVFQPLALFFVDFRTALVLVAVFHVFSNISRLALFRKGIDKKMLVRFGLPSVATTLVGAILVAYVSQDFFKLMLGAFLVIFSLYTLTGHKAEIRSTNRNELLGGALSGLLAGLIGTGGALRSAFLTGFGMKKNEYVATASAIALLVDLTRVPVYLASGFLGAQYYSDVPVLLVMAIAGAYVGKRVVDYVSQETFRKIVLVALALIGLKLVSDGLVVLL